MTMRKSLFALLVALGVSTLARADEGMWLLEQLSKKYPELVKRGLAMQEYDLYNPTAPRSRTPSYTSMEAVRVR